MLIKYQVRVGNNNIIIPMDNNIKTVGYEESIINNYIPEEIEKSLPDHIDSEVKKFKGDFKKITLVLMKNNLAMTLDDFSFNDDDLKFFSNRLKNSFLLVSFYDKPNKLTRKLIYNTTLFFQRNNLYEDNVLKNKENVEIVFNIQEPSNYNETEGFNILIEENQTIDTLYANFRFNCALDGTSYVFYPKETVNITNVAENEEYVKINLNTDSYSYDSPEIINIDGNNILKLYAIN